MSKKYPGGIIRGTPVVPTTSSAPGIWTVCQAQNYTRQGLWPRSPGAPTIGTATAGAGGSGSATVAFTTPSDLGAGSITYTAISTPGSLTGTSATSPITVSGLTIGTSYTFRVFGTTPGGTGPASAASNSITPTAVTGQQAFTTPGLFTWVAPSGVTSVSAVAVGGGTYVGGGALGYRNNITVVPGTSYSVRVGNDLANCSNVSQSFFINTSTVRGGSAIACVGQSTFTGDGGGRGGLSISNGGKGGAGGYSGNGGQGAPLGTGRIAGNPGAGGGGGGGARADGYNGIAGGGGGVGLFGEGASGAGGVIGANNFSAPGGGGGSGGVNGTAGGTYSYFCCGVLITAGTTGGLGFYGGSGGGGAGDSAATGAVRIIWPGTTRFFPSTNTGNL
jgi:hypothetical protein